MKLYLTKLRKCRDPALEAVSALLDPNADGARMDADHRLVWSLFAGDKNARRDFLWRTEGRRDLLVLSHREPGPSPFFEPPEIRPFAPNLRPGDRLAFALKANATKTVTPDKSDLSASGKPRRKHHDIVMDALFRVPRQALDDDDGRSQRAARRMDIAREAAEAWLAGQGARGGFAPLEMSVEDYSVVTLPPGPRKNRPRFGVLDLVGRLEVTDPAAFLDRLGTGFGRARAFGCGLMLIRRA